jgi:predicted transcriptional regulator
MDRLRELFAESYIDIPEDRADLVDEMQKSVEELTSKLQIQNEKAEAVLSELIEMKKSTVRARITDGMAKTEIEKFDSVISEVAYEDDASYAEKLNVIKENYFPKAPKTKELEPEVIEGAATGKMAKYAAVLDRAPKFS